MAERPLSLTNAVCFRSPARSNAEPVKTRIVSASAQTFGFDSGAVARIVADVLEIPPAIPVGVDVRSVVNVDNVRLDAFCAYKFHLLSLLIVNRHSDAAA